MKIGVFIAYEPNAELSNQGLGRLLRELVRGLLEIEGTEVVLLCPSWLKADAEDFFSDTRAPGLSIQAPPTVPALVRLRSLWTRRRRRPVDRVGLLARALRLARHLAGRLLALGEAAVVALLSIRSIYLFALVMTAVAVAAILLVPLSALVLLVVAGALIPLLIGRIPAVRRLAAHGRSLLDRVRARRRAGSRPSLKVVVFDRIFREETDLMVRMADAQRDVDVWFSPTVFWPEFSRIDAPTVQAFPDMLISEFPTSFAVEMPRQVEILRRASLAIKSGRHFTAYSEATAHGALGRRFEVDRSDIHIIPHAPIDLSRFIAIRGTLDDDHARRKFATDLIHGYRHAGWAADPYLRGFDFTDARFIFYASQFRPNKNLMNLVKAFEIVLRRRHENCKLILTGNFAHAPEVEQYIQARRLNRDVVSAFDVPDAVLAAFYAKAQLAVNPTLYEGGFPFTFAEGMSVGTPSIMSRIPQVTDVIGGELAEEMLFNPYSTDDMAERIVCGLRNRDRLIALQQPLYDRMKGRSWVDVARDHVAAFQAIIERERG
jgi:glycosyltransferase involved in cell wall biosynthesis